MKRKEVDKERLNKLIRDLTWEGADEEVTKLKYLNDEYWNEICEKRYAAISEADILASENDSYSKSEYEMLRQEIRNYDLLIQNKKNLKRIGYETYLRIERSRDIWQEQ